MKNILIVDDESLVRDLLGQYLEEAGYDFWKAEDVQQAKAVLADQEINLILSDINMPGESGIDLARFVKKTYPDIATVILSILDNPDAAKEAFDLGVYGYIVKPFTKNIVLIGVENALKRHRLESENRTYRQELEREVQRQSIKTQASEEKYRQIVDNIGIGVAILSPQMEIRQMNPQMHNWFSHVEPNKGFICHKSFWVPPKESPCEDCPVVKTLAEGKSFEAIIRVEGKKHVRYLRDHSSPIHDENGNIAGVILLVEDVTDKLALERELRQTQKLEAIGQLAAGIAHEINTPIQYVGDNTEFLQASFKDMATAFDAYDELLQAVKNNSVTDSFLETVEKSICEADLLYLNEEIPRAIEQSLEGVKRVTGIVRAMRDFSHPGSENKTLVNINNAIHNTLTVARNEWKYVAEMELDLDPLLPEVFCLPGEINQVLLNLIVNAAHAIADALDEEKMSMGKISISTRKNFNSVEIHISDTGAGIPPAIQHRIFDPFFTTKGQGKGTGQGLAIAHRVITEKHEGNLSFETCPGEGTTFIIELPLRTAEE